MYCTLRSGPRLVIPDDAGTFLDDFGISQHCLKPLGTVTALQSTTALLSTDYTINSTTSLIHSFAEVAGFLFEQSRQVPNTYIFINNNDNDNEKQNETKQK